MTGQWGSTFTASNLASTTPPTTVQGVADPTGTWNELFFAKATTFGGTGGLNSGPEQWSWAYRSAADNCGHSEVWLDANNNNGGQVTAANGGTDITAPAPAPARPDRTGLFLAAMPARWPEHCRRAGILGAHSGRDGARHRLDGV